MAGLGRRVAPMVAGALVAAGLVAAPAHAVDAIDGPLTSGDSLFPNQGNGGYDVGHYDVDLAWTPGAPSTPGTIDATTTIAATTTGPPLSSFGLDLEGLTVSGVTVDGAVAAWSRINGTDGATPGQHKLVVTPATPVDGAFTVVVAYGGVPTERHDTDGSDEGWIPTLDGATFMNQPIGSMTGFPNNNTPKDKATYTFTVHVPDTFEVVSNGEPTSIPPNGAPRTWVWNETQPMASELALISIGQYQVLTSTINLSGGRSVPEWTFVDSAIWASSSSTIEARRAQLSPILTGLESFLGPYPGHSTGIVVDTTMVGYALETQDRPTWPSASSVNGSLVHELTHQWYGDAVAPADWNGLWVNEGMATWAPTRYGGGNTETTYFNTWNSTGTGSSLWTIPPSGMTVPSQLFGWQSYTRGAMTYEALRAAIGDPAYFQLIKQWQTDFGGQTKKWTNLIALAEQLSGRNLTAFFQDWIYDPDKPAWPGKLSLVLGAAPGAGPVPAGSALSYSLTATNTGKVPLTGAVVSVDLTHVLDHATLGTLPAELSLTGTTLTWTVPTTAVGGVAATSFPAAVQAAAEGATLSASASISTLGGTCATCTVTHTVGPQAEPPPPPGAIGTECGVTVTGKARVGRRLRAVVAGCPAGASLDYQWYVGTKPIGSATAATYRIKGSKAGKRIKVVVTVAVPGYVTTQRVSALTRRVRR
ncbi:MAG: hypothetical protein QOD98_1890 [Nocardioidaceae bacterium]|nr:hypothetical protein [Nocardioidaceae bacterium]